MKALVTGGCGFLGSNIAAALLDRRDRVYVIDALFRNGSNENLSWLQSRAEKGQLTFLMADVAQHTIVEEFFRQYGPFDLICHLAGQVAMTVSLADPRRDMLTNVVGTFNVLEATRQFSPEALFVYSSTNKVYGDLLDLKREETVSRYSLPDFPTGFSESLPLDFASPYGCSKGAADQYVRDWHRNYGLRTVVFRHSSIYGGRQFATYDQGWIGWFCRKAIEQQVLQQKGAAVQSFTISGTGKQVRDVLHAQDLVNLYLRAATAVDEIAGQVFNIGGGIENSLSILELFALLEERLGMPSPLSFERLPRRQSDQDFFVADIMKIKSVLGWTPEVSCRAGIDQMLKWTQECAL